MLWSTFLDRTYWKRSLYLPGEMKVISQQITRSYWPWQNYSANIFTWMNCSWTISLMYMPEIGFPLKLGIYGISSLSIFFPLQQTFTAVIARIIPPPLRYMFSPGLSNGRDNRIQRFVLQLCWWSLKGLVLNNTLLSLFLSNSRNLKKE